MSTPLRVLLACLLAATLLGAPAAPARAQDTSAIAINTKDGADLFKFAFQIKKTMKDVVDSTNAAVAYSSCDQCSTVAISFQVVLAGGDPSTVTPQNIAIALNENCTSCVTAAFAYQFIVAGSGPITLTKEGERRLKDLRKHLRDLESQPLTIDQLAAELDRAAQEIRDVLATELQPAGKDGSFDDNGQTPDQRAPPDGSDATPSATPESGAPPAATPGGTPTATPTATATPSDTPTPTPTPTATP